MMVFGGIAIVEKKTGIRLKGIQRIGYYFVKYDSLVK